jgi:hypothetical protein
LFHLPIAIAVQLAFKSYGLQYPWVPLAVILLSLGLVHALNIAFSRFFFESCKQATLRMPWKSHLKKN